MRGRQAPWCEAPPSGTPRRRSLWVLGACLALTAAARAEATWHVAPHGRGAATGAADDPFATIQAALDHPLTESGDTVLVAPGTYVENLDFGDKRLTLAASHGPDATVLTPRTGGDLVRMAEPAATPFAAGSATRSSLRGFTLRGSTSPDGALVRAAFSRLEHCVLRDNPQGFGVLCGSDVEVDHCTVVRCGTGVVCAPGGSAAVTSSILWANVVDVELGLGRGWVRRSAGLASYEAAGEGNLRGAPGFWSLERGDVHLAPGSPCIGAGLGGTDAGALPYDAGYAPEPWTFCDPKADSTGCMPGILFSGTPSASLDAPFLVSAGDVRTDRAGFLVYGFAAQEVPFFDGVLCVQDPTPTPVQLARLPEGPASVEGCAAGFAFDFNRLIQSGLDSRLTPGTFVYAQYWYRDARTSFCLGLSNALGFAIAP